MWLLLGTGSACGPSTQEFCADLGEYPRWPGGAATDELFEWQQGVLNRFSTDCIVRSATVDDEVQLTCDAQNGTPVDMRVGAEKAHTVDLLAGETVQLHVARWRMFERFSSEVVSLIDGQDRTRFALVNMSDSIPPEVRDEMLSYLEGDFQVSVEEGELCEIEPDAEVGGRLSAQRFILHASNAQTEDSVVAPALDFSLGDGRLDFKVGHWKPDSTLLVGPPSSLWFTYRTE